MPTLTITKNYADGSTLTKAHLDTAYDSISTFINTTKLDTNNIQSGGVAEGNIAAAAVTETKIGTGAVTVTKIGDDAVTKDKVHSNVAGSGLGQNADGSLEVNVDGSTLEINSDTLRVKDAGITKAKLAALGQQISSEVTLHQIFSASYTDVTNLSVSITTTGRPVWIGVTGGSSLGYFASTTIGYVRFLRDASQIYETEFDSNLVELPVSSFWTVDTPAAGTYTYKVQAKTTSAGNHVDFAYAKLVVFEL